MYGILMTTAAHAAQAKSELADRDFLSDKLDVCVSSFELAKSDMIKSKDFVIVQSDGTGITERVLLNFSSISFEIGRMVIRFPEPVVFTVMIKKSCSSLLNEITFNDDFTLCEFLDKFENIFHTIKVEGGIKRVAELFTKIGLFANLEGYRMLLAAVRRAVADPDELHKITTKMYPEIAKSFNTTSKAVERNIRHAITVVFNKGKLAKVSNSLYGGNFDDNEKPSNGEFIAFLSVIALGVI